jgi:hypothetical protein
VIAPRALIYQLASDQMAKGFCLAIFWKDSHAFAALFDKHRRYVRPGNY